MSGNLGFIGKWIADKMENPEDRDAAFKIQMEKTMSECARIKAGWTQPMRQDGYWASNGSILTYINSLEPALKHGPGRRNILEHTKE